MTQSLSSLLTPVPREEFLKKYEGREYLYVGRGIAGFYDDIVSVKDLDAYLQSGLLPITCVDVVTDGVHCPPETWSKALMLGGRQQLVCVPESLFRLYREGATLILNVVHEAFASLAVTCSQLARELACPVQANIYITPPNARGFNVHRDDHDVLILQLSGSKKWLVHPSVESNPCSLDMREGDILFIPRGMPHEARCSEDPSIHVTVGLYTTCAFHLVEELAAASRDSALFQDLVLNSAGPPEDVRAFETEFIRRLTVLLQEITVPRLIERRSIGFINKERPRGPGRLTDMLLLPGLGPDAVLCARPMVGLRIETIENVVTLHFGGARVTIPAFLKPCLDQMLVGIPFAVRDLKGMLTEDGRVGFVRPFVDAGLLSIVRI